MVGSTTPLLEQPVVQPHDHAAVDLALPGQLVDDQARVLDGDDLLDLDHAGLDVDGDLGELAAADADAARARAWNVAGLGDRRSCPSLRQASFHAMTGSPVTQSWPSLSDRSSGWALTAGAIFLKSASRALVTAS